MSYFSKYPFIVEDKKARSLSFFCKKEIVSLNRDILDELKEIAFREKRDVRISMHQSPESNLHSMIILQHKGSYVKPHKHYVEKAETYHLMEGTQSVFIFDEIGSVIDRCDMSLDGNLLYRFEKNYFHMSIPTSEYVIFHESKMGPFIGAGDNIVASWAPAYDDKETINKFTQKLMKIRLDK